MLHARAFPPVSTRFTLSGVEWKRFKKAGKRIWNRDFITRKPLSFRLISYVRLVMVLSKEGKRERKKREIQVVLHIDFALINRAL